MGSWSTGVGLNNVGSYQVSGKPYASGSIVPAASGSTLLVSFPAVTKWIQILPQDGAAPLRVSFTENGMHAGNYFHVHGNNASGSAMQPLNLKVSQIWLMSTNGTQQTVDVLAGLTTIAPGSVETADGPNWSGTDGVG